MSGEDDSGEILEMGVTAFRSFIEDVLFGEVSPLFDLKTRSLKPLFRIEATNESVTVTFDLPYVKKNDISLSSTEDILSIEAKMRKNVALRVGGTTQKHIRFERYIRQIRLPTRIDPKRAKATFRNGLLRVKFPVEKRGSRVRIGS